MVVKQLVAVVAAVIVGTADRPFWASGGTKRVARAASRPKLHGQGRPGRFHESVVVKEEQKGSVDLVSSMKAW